MTARTGIIMPAVPGASKEVRACAESVMAQVSCTDARKVKSGWGGRAGRDRIVMLPSPRNRSSYRCRCSARFIASSYDKHTKNRPAPAAAAEELEADLVARAAAVGPILAANAAGPRPRRHLGARVVRGPARRRPAEDRRAHRTRRGRRDRAAGRDGAARARHVLRLDRPGHRDAPARHGLHGLALSPWAAGCRGDAASGSPRRASCSSPPAEPTSPTRGERR